MTKLIELDQRSPEWEAWRAGGIGASEAAVIWSGISFDRTWDSLLEDKLDQYLNNKKVHRNIKRGLPPRERSRRDTDRMAWGVKWESAGRETYIDHYGLWVRPICAVSEDHPFMLASLDGLSTDNKTVLEVKCPTPMSRFSAHKKALSGQVPDYYHPQIWHQFAVTEARAVHYYSYLPDEPSVEKAFSPSDRKVLIVVRPKDKLEKDGPTNEERVKQLISREQDFWDELQERIRQAE